MDIASDELFNIVQVTRGEDLEDIYDGDSSLLCKCLL